MAGCHVCACLVRGDHDGDGDHHGRDIARVRAACARTRLCAGVPPPPSCRARETAVLGLRGSGAGPRTHPDRRRGV
eukprot:1609902-Pleurochrysis_carterae.AAC.4